MITLRDVTDADLDVLLALNQADSPALGSLDRARLAALVDMAAAAVTTERAQALLLVLGPGADYRSLNYRWFDGRFRNYLYVDRIVVAPSLRGGGVGAAMYEHLVAIGRARGAARILCEVNVHPPNPRSVTFHEAVGFRRSGIRSGGPDGKTVAMMTMHLR